MHLAACRERDLERERLPVHWRAARCYRAACERISRDAKTRDMHELTVQVDTIVRIRRRLRPHKCQCTVLRVGVSVLAVGVVEVAAPQAKKPREPFLEEHHVSVETLQRQVKAE